MSSVPGVSSITLTANAYVLPPEYEELFDEFTKRLKVYHAQIGDDFVPFTVKTLRTGKMFNSSLFIGTSVDKYAAYNYTVQPKTPDKNSSIYLDLFYDYTKINEIDKDYHPFTDKVALEKYKPYMKGVNALMLCSIVARFVRNGVLNNDSVFGLSAQPFSKHDDLEDIPYEAWFDLTEYYKTLSFNYSTGTLRSKIKQALRKSIATQGIFMTTTVGRFMERCHGRFTRRPRKIDRRIIDLQNELYHKWVRMMKAEGETDETIDFENLRDYVATFKTEHELHQFANEAFGPFTHKYPWLNEKEEVVVKVEPVHDDDDDDDDIQVDLEEASEDDESVVLPHDDDFNLDAYAPPNTTSDTSTSTTLTRPPDGFLTDDLVDEPIIANTPTRVQFSSNVGQPTRTLLNPDDAEEPQYLPYTVRNYINHNARPDPNDFFVPTPDTPPPTPPRSAVVRPRSEVRWIGNVLDITSDDDDDDKPNNKRVKWS